MIQSMATPMEENDTTQEEEEEEEEEESQQEEEQHQSNLNLELHSISATIVIRQLPSQGIGFQLWPAATTLLNLLDRSSHSSAHPNPLSSLFDNSHCGRRLRILELGSGTGVVGIAAAALLGAHVTLTDLPHVLPNLQFNATANAGILGLHGGAVDVAALRWGDTWDMEASAIGSFKYDLILGSDLVYHDHLYEPLLQTLRFFLLRGGSDHKVAFLMAHLKRWKKESSFFKKVYKFFDVEILHTDSPSDGSRVGVTVYQFVRRNGGGQKFTSNSFSSDFV